MCSERIKVVVPDLNTARVKVALRGLYQPIVLLMDIQGNAIEDGSNANEHWAITPEENEAIT